MNFIKDLTNKLFELSYDYKFLNVWFRNISLNFTYPFLKSLLKFFDLKIILRNSILTNDFKAFGSDIDFSIIGKQDQHTVWIKLYSILRIFFIRLKEWEYYTDEENIIINKIRNSNYFDILNFIRLLRKIEILNKSNSSTFKKSATFKKIIKDTNNFTIPNILSTGEFDLKEVQHDNFYSHYLNLSIEDIKANFNFQSDKHLIHFLFILPDNLSTTNNLEILKLKIIVCLNEFVVVQNKLRITPNDEDLKNWSNKLFFFLYLNKNIKILNINLPNFLLNYEYKNFKKLEDRISNFCMAPWIHFHIMPNKNVIPCCDWPYKDNLGDVIDSSLFDVWNNKNFSNLRLKMLFGEPIENCSKCYKKDQLNHHSLRWMLTKNNFHHIKESIDSTDNSGRLNNFKMIYFDVRFSNICNFKCRGCSPELSSSWLSDYEILHDEKTGKSPYINIFPNDKLESQLIELIPTIEHAYFAGGEPLVMKEHYLFLEKFIEHKRTDIKLAYNTNLSTLRFKDKNIIEYWSHFSEISLGISIDDLKQRNEYFRKGTNWDELISNINWIKNNCPHIYIYINITISNITVSNLHNLYEYLIDNKIVQPEQINFNLVFNPEIYSIQTLPKLLKNRIKATFLDYIKTCENKYPHDLKKISAHFQYVLNHMMNEHKSRLFKEFLIETKKLDKIRNEKLTDFFPEFLPFY